MKRFCFDRKKGLVLLKKGVVAWRKRRARRESAGCAERVFKIGFTP